jgi:hypothetical protein
MPCLLFSRIKKQFSPSRPIRNSNISRKTKLRIFSSNVKAVLLYGVETWKANIVIRRKLQTFINRCLRKIINIHWPEKKRSQELLELAGEEPVETQIKRRKWTWKVTHLENQMTP